MKPSKACCTVLIVALSLGAWSGATWSTRLQGKIITGEVTSMPASGQIEVDHQTYRVRAGTSADRNLRKFHMGQVVDLELDGPSASKNAQVISIAVHTGAPGSHD